MGPAGIPQFSRRGTTTCLERHTSKQKQVVPPIQRRRLCGTILLMQTCPSAECVFDGLERQFNWMRTGAKLTRIPCLDAHSKCVRFAFAEITATCRSLVRHVVG